MIQFTHLHVHTHYSVLDGMSKIEDLINKCRSNGMNAIAITDHGNMFGIKELIDTSNKINGKVKDAIKAIDKQIAEAAGDNARTEELRKQRAETEKTYFKPIIGCEAYCARRTLYDKDKELKNIDPESGKEYFVDRSGYHLVLLAKNQKGYENLCKLISTAWVDGFYYRPRIDKKLLEQYHEGLIISSACLGGEIPKLIMANKTDEAEKTIMWFKSLVGDDFYLELQRHKTDKPNSEQGTYPKQVSVNKILLELAAKTNTKVIATNDVHFVEEEHAEAHDHLICLATSKDLDDPNRMRYTKQEWLKTPDEMAAIFADIPEALSNTQEIVDKVEPFSLDRPPIMPMFDIPADFGTEEDYRQRISHQELFDEFTRNEKGEAVMTQEEAEKKIKILGGYDRLYRIKLEADYLRHLALNGAKMRYGDPVPDDIMERIIFELHVMKTMGFPGYFLIVQDFIMAARNMGVSVGPGRGSAAGSVVAYCLKITDVDPLKYDLLFERFLNPDRISLPDIDIDFDDDGRGEVLRWVTNKYGAERVAHIITYGTMATKSSIKDVGRVEKVPLPQVNKLTALIPDKFGDDKADPKTGKIPKVNIKNCIKYIPELASIRDGENRELSTVLRYAEMLEGTVRQTGIHACGVIIGADDLKKFAPLSTAKDKDTGEDVLVTQYEGSVIESVGLIKMDFLGLKTLSIIKEALKNIRISKGVELDIDKIPIDDPDTYKLYSDGRTIGTFQFESPGMQKYLKELQPSTFEDLIAMNALYRPGPMDYIPQFIARKHGKEPIVYDLDCMETYLKDTYGITVYQEQVMLLSRLLANFTRGESDALRKAMGKKLRDKLDQMKPKFISQGQTNGHDPQILEKIWGDWEKFASYAFNKSHATCYSWVSYQTAYLKAHYPAEFMAANLTRNRDNIIEITKFMEECKKMNVNVKGPDVNESDLNFTVNKAGEIRFGMGGVKGVGQGAVEAIVNERNKNGNYKNIFDFVERVNLSACNRKSIESLAYAGGFDCFNDITREQFFAPNHRGEITIDNLIRYGQRYQQDKINNSNTLFDDCEEMDIPKPYIPKCDAWSGLERLNKEKELIGIYLSAHPLDQYKIPIMYGCSTRLADMENIKKGEDCTFTVAGLITSTRSGTSSKGNPYGVFTLEDYSGSFEFPLFGKDYTSFAGFMKENVFVTVRGKIQERGADWKYPPKKDPGAPRPKELKITSIDLLSEIADKMTTRLTITLELGKITPMLTSDLLTLLENNTGASELQIVVHDPETATTMPLRSKKIHLSITASLIDELNGMQAEGQLSFKIN
ncbi:MAG: DNA polymerase III subunit alpha [Candidatus Aphodosoma sp.]